MARVKIAIVADSHFDQHSRFDECKRIHEWIAMDASNRGCTVWAHAGDLYERKSTPEERRAAADWVQFMADAVGPGVIVRGNHDIPGDLPLLGRLDTNGQGIHVVEDARGLDIGGVHFACVAWPQRGGLVGESSDETEAGAQGALRNVLRGLGAHFPDGQPCVLVTHAMVRGSETSTGQPLIGHHFELGLEDLALVGADFIALGHIHKGQDWDVAGAPAVYPGSPRRCNYGEMEPKGYLVVEFDGTHLVGWERIATPCTEMHHVDLAWGDGGFLGCDPDVIEQLDGEVRVRWHVAREHREAARTQAERIRDQLLAQGCEVKLEERVTVETRARAPEVAAAPTLSEKLSAYWTSKGYDPGDRRQPLLSKLSTLEVTP